MLRLGSSRYLAKPGDDLQRKGAGCMTFCRIDTFFISETPATTPQAGKCRSDSSCEPWRGGPAAGLLSLCAHEAPTALPRWSGIGSGRTPFLEPVKPFGDELLGLVRRRVADFGLARRPLIPPEGLLVASDLERRPRNPVCSGPLRARLPGCPREGGPSRTRAWPPTKADQSARPPGRAAAGKGAGRAHPAERPMTRDSRSLTSRRREAKHHVEDIVRWTGRHGRR